MFPVEVNANYVEFKGKQYYCAFARDLSERQRIESKLEQAQKLEAIGTLAGGVAHDLNNVLGGLVGYPELILMDMPKDSPLRKPLTTIKDSGIKAAAIVQDLLTLARRGAVVHEVVNLNYIISDYLKTPEHQNLVKFHPGIEFKVDLDPSLLNNLGSSIHISKTIMNLISNGAEAIKKQEVSTQHYDKIIVTQVVPSPSSAEFEIVDKYRTAHARHFPDDEPNYVALEGFVNAQILVESLKRAGPDLTRSQLINTLENMKNVDIGLGKQLTYGEFDRSGLTGVYYSRLAFDTGKFEIFSQ